MSNSTFDVFISYSHDSAQHEERVLELADRLREDGINAIIDQYQSAPPEGWQLWMEKQIDNAKFVISVCTETYLRRVKKEEAPGKGLGVLWEASIIYSHLYDAGVVNEKFIPIVFEPSDTHFIPRPLKPTTYYDVSTDAGYERLYRRLTDQPETSAPSLGQRRTLPSRQRSTSKSSAQPIAQLAPNLVHPYALQANFTGRVSERNELTAWLADDTHPICALVAMGGMGKSALAWYWMKNDVLTHAQPTASTVDGVMWWSFYEGESSFAKFIDDALKYVSGQPIDVASLPTTYDRAQELRKLLQNRRILFILDGFERQLRAYARLDAAYQQDDTADKSREARGCVDPIAARWLTDIAAGTTRAKVLLTTRLMPRDLEDRAGDALAGVFERELKELPRDDAVKFMRQQGVINGTTSEIATVCDAYGYHPLSLRLLSGLIARDARTPGDISTAPRHDVYDNLVQRQHHILEQSYNALPEKERTLLSRLAAFRSPMTYDALAIFNDFGSEANFENALEDLQERGLVQRDTADKRSRYDLHPIVRHYAYDRLTDKTGVHTRLRDYFEKIPVPDENKVQSIEDLAPVIELYHHTVCAQRFDEAVNLLYSRLNKLLYYRFGAYQTEIELLRALFPDGEDRPPRFKDESAQAWALNALANSYSLFGQPRHAVPLFEMANDMYENRIKNKRHLAIGLGNIAGMAQIVLGALAAASQNLKKEFDIYKELKSDLDIAQNRMVFGYLLVYCGDFENAKQVLKFAESLARKEEHEQTLCLVWIIRTLCALLIGDAQTAMKAGQKAFEFWEKYAEGVYPVERDIIWTQGLLGAALVMNGKDLTAAAGHLTDALSRCRRINLMELEPDILLAWARWYSARENVPEAQAHAEEALTIANRCEYRLKQAEIHNFLARLALNAGDREVARREADIAKERAWCDGPPYYYKTAFDEAERMLKELDKKRRKK